MDANFKIPPCVSSVSPVATNWQSESLGALETARVIDHLLRALLTTSQAPAIPDSALPQIDQNLCRLRAEMKNLHRNSINAIFKYFFRKNGRPNRLNNTDTKSESTESIKDAMKPNRLLFLILCLCPLAVYAQTAEVGGAVQDPSGAVIPKASVEFRNQDTGIRRQTTSNGDGYYHITGVDPGKYDATVQAKGFKTLTRENITFQVGDKSQIDFKMQVGDTGQTVTVDGSGLTINTTDGSVSTVIDQKFVENIPLNRRSFQDLISMTPELLHKARSQIPN